MKHLSDFCSATRLITPKKSEIRNVKVFAGKLIEAVQSVIIS